MQSLLRVHRLGLPMVCERTREKVRMPSRYTDDWITIRTRYRISSYLSPINLSFLRSS